MKKAHTPEVRLHTLDLNLLVVLRELLATTSVSETARRLGRTQSAVSHALGRLRRLLDDPLLVRAGERMVATPRAGELQAPLADALERLAAAVAARGGFEPRRLRRRFLLGAADYHELVLLPRLTAALAEQAPEVELQTLNVGDEVERLTQRGELDLALAVVSRRPPGLAVEPLFAEELVVVMRRGHPLARGAFTLERFVAAGHMVVAPRGRPGSMVDERLAERGLERRVILHTAHFGTAPEVVAATDLLVTLPRRLARLFAPRLDLVEREPPVEVGGFTISLVYHEAQRHDAAHSWLRARIHEAAADRRAAGRPPGRRAHHSP